MSKKGGPHVVSVCLGFLFHEILPVDSHSKLRINSSPSPFSRNFHAPKLLSSFILHTVSCCWTGSSFSAAGTLPTCCSCGEFACWIVKVFSLSSGPLLPCTPPSIQPASTFLFLSSIGNWQPLFQGISFPQMLLVVPKEIGWAPSSFHSAVNSLHPHVAAAGVGDAAALFWLARSVMPLHPQSNLVQYLQKEINHERVATGWAT